MLNRTVWGVDDWDTVQLDADAAVSSQVGSEGVVRAAAGGGGDQQPLPACRIGVRRPDRVQAPPLDIRLFYAKDGGEVFVHEFCGVRHGG